MGELIAKLASAPWMAGATKRATVKSVENILLAGMQGIAGVKRRGGRGTRGMRASEGVEDEEQILENKLARDSAPNTPK